MRVGDPLPTEIDVFNVEIVMPDPGKHLREWWAAHPEARRRGTLADPRPQCPACGRHVSRRKDGALRAHCPDDRPGVPCDGGGTGRAERERCPCCNRTMSRNRDGQFRAHRPTADALVGTPLCPGGNTTIRY